MGREEAGGTRMDLASIAGPWGGAGHWKLARVAGQFWNLEGPVRFWHPTFKHRLSPSHVPGLVTPWDSTGEASRALPQGERQAQRQMHKITCDECSEPGNQSPQQGEGRFLRFLGQDNPTGSRESEMCPDVPR